MNEQLVSYLEDCNGELVNCLFISIVINFILIGLNWYNYGRRAERADRSERGEAK